jgi:hypothetical protein
MALLILGCKSSHVFRSSGTLVAIEEKGTAACLLRTEDGKHVRLSGKLEKGLVGLPGSHVLLEGELRPSVPYPEVDVRNYTILSISGKRPFVGVLRKEDGRFRLESGEGRALELDVGGLKEGTLPKPGATLWATGSVVGDTLRVERFGVLAPWD